MPACWLPMTAARAFLVALVVAAALFLDGAAAAAGGNAGAASPRQRLVRSHLKRLNKAPVATIESPDGDFIDCVHISNQPAFDHPFLKNHTIQVPLSAAPLHFSFHCFSVHKLQSFSPTCIMISLSIIAFQMRPAYHPEGLYDESKVASQQQTQIITQMWHQNGKCPENTIPIRRTKKEDVLRASSVRRYGKKRHRSTPNPMSVDPDMLNESGHQVSPDLYGDNNTRLFTYWTSDAYQATGCYNLLCSGFIQINNQIAMGASIFPISNYGGSQYDINILVWKDPKEGNWWLQFGNNYVLGYWPSFLFSYLADSASMIEWGGEVVNSEPDGGHTTTQMGSGHFPEEGFGKASYFRNIQVVDSSNNLKPPKGVGSFTEQSNCYDVQNGNNGDWGTYFYYGGPGKNPNCP
ncbi:hypothetical protein HU200_054748 [Digitaria exilis]|uniref:Neprosin PEP catalytic domain-containing protein n=1 Tax=Digitaria exilis TaxID=1010633 RepID=A0A835E414_9POAL|nr:hypothetical protein HU200_054748 [Digitaria exilis]